jgi:glutamate-5-semialdehyde dehydrogenase
MDTRKMSLAAKAAAIELAGVKNSVKNKALAAVAEMLKAQSRQIAAANQKDLAAAKEGNLAGPLLKRLKFDEDKIAEVCAGIESLIRLEDPVGRILAATELDAGLELYRCYRGSIRVSA